MAKRFSFKGYYKGWFFRSLREVSYVLLCEKNGLTWKGAETDEFTVTYTDLYGRTRKHYPDFFVDGHIVVEVKPTRHQKGKLVQLKATAMKEFCKTKGYTYMMVSPRRIQKAELEELIKNNEITFTDECSNKISQYLKRRK
jgi:hypothetical protein